MFINRQIRLYILHIILLINYTSTSYSQSKVVKSYKGGKHIQAIVTTWLFKSIENELNYPYIFDIFFVFLFVKVFDAGQIWKSYEETFRFLLSIIKKMNVMPFSKKKKKPWIYKVHSYLLLLKLISEKCTEKQVSLYLV